MTKTIPVWMGILGTIGYSFALSGIMLIGYLALVLSAPGVGDTHRWARDANYIASGAFVFGGVSVAALLLFSCFKRFMIGFAFAIPLAVASTVLSAYLPTPLLKYF